MNGAIETYVKKTVLAQECSFFLLIFYAISRRINSRISRNTRRIWQNYFLYNEYQNKVG